jgi:hypothetical protein
MAHSELPPFVLAKEFCFDKIVFKQWHGEQNQTKTPPKLMHNTPTGLPDGIFGKIMKCLAM